MDEKKRYHILVEYNDGSFQWIKDSTEKEAAERAEVKIIRSYCNTNFNVDARRWKTGRSQFERIILT
jgi:hypothetical protein